mmetsp:Transcript_2640/g.10548  ORF Transcript_2640/g.10548 Transcript_2640/m.10548 type:complete len:290 (-) Transcript_2640:793-1662(-)
MTPRTLKSLLLSELPLRATWGGSSDASLSLPLPSERGTPPFAPAPSGLVGTDSSAAPLAACTDDTDDTLLTPLERAPPAAGAAAVEGAAAADGAGALASESTSMDSWRGIAGGDAERDRCSAGFGGLCPSLSDPSDRTPFDSADRALSVACWAPDASLGAGRSSCVGAGLGAEVGAGPGAASGWSAGTSLERELIDVTEPCLAMSFEEEACRAMSFEEACRPMSATLAVLALCFRPPSAFSCLKKGALRSSCALGRLCAGSRHMRMSSRVSSFLIFFSAPGISRLETLR